MGWRNERLIEVFWSYDQDGSHVHILLNPLNFFSGTNWPRTLKLGIQHWGLRPYKVCSNYVSRLTLTLFTAFVWENPKTLDFIETVEVYHLKFGTHYNWLSEYMNTYGYQKLMPLFVLCPNIFCSKTAWRIEARFHVEPLWVRGTKIYSNGPSHMSKMTVMPIYGQNLLKVLFSKTYRLIAFELNIEQRGLMPYKVYSNDKPVWPWPS